MPTFLLRSLALALLAPLALGQVRLPVVPLVSKPLNSLQGTVNGVEARAVDSLSQLRRLQIAELVRNNPKSIDTDSHGNPIVRHEILGMPSDEAALEKIRALKFQVLRESGTDALGLKLLVLHAGADQSTQKSLKQLRGADPAGTYDFNHIYMGSAAAPVRVAQLPPDDAPRALPDPPLQPTLRGVRIGLVDTGVELHHATLVEARIHTFGCGDKPVAAEHGTAVASLMVGHAEHFSGVRPGAELYAADVYCGQPTGGAVDALVAAFAWLAGERVGVINVSLVGPANALLERAVAALIARGFVIAAAVGNDGPAAPPLYPASYPHVVGVTGVDAHQHVLLEAARGPQVMFAAPGADLAAAQAGGGYEAVRGTSFASPIVAALLAAEIPQPDPAASAAAVEALARSARHLGKPGRDLTYGFGLVGFEYRIDPATLPHR